ncbi:uncharacterized protein [Ptychodera flava]|uniref:uncharacterized protein n=1 Tax=Ptychodera flava TaxID=63121 RepID=UPI003969D1AD
MPEGKSNEELANDFADFFLQKILKIRELLANNNNYIPPYREVPSFHQFEPVDEDTVEKIVKEMPTKSCELDIIPTKFLKDVLKGMVPHITKLINASLQRGVFVKEWKYAVVRKKTGLDLISSNYRPVSNLAFLSKVLEKIALQQLTNTVNGVNSFQNISQLTE